MRFTKMHGIGNDYIYVNGFAESIEDPAAAARALSDRHFGIGSDGLIIIGPSEKADFEMAMYNADGSRGRMCGNGIRCVGKYVYDNGMTDKTHLTVETPAGIKTLDLHVKDGRVETVRVDMGAPILRAEDVPVDVFAAAGSGLTLTDVPGVGGMVLGSDFHVTDSLTVQATCVSMGNPHCVVPVRSVSRMDVEHIGPLFEHHAAFPERVNTEFIRVEDRENVRMRVWERGSGETWACGTGACAVAVACILNGWTQERVTVHLRGGDLEVEWDRAADTVWMTGPAVTVFEGEI